MKGLKGRFLVFVVAALCLLVLAFLFSLHPPPPTSSSGASQVEPPDVTTTMCLLDKNMLQENSTRRPCVESGDQDTINDLFNVGGKGTKVFLCPNALIELTDTIYFSAPNQELATASYPTDDTRAMVRIINQDLATAIDARCRRCAGARIRNIKVSGNVEELSVFSDLGPYHIYSKPKTAYLQMMLGTALISLGGEASRQLIDRCEISQPRSYAAVAAHGYAADAVDVTQFEDRNAMYKELRIPQAPPTCNRIVITNNVILGGGLPGMLSPDNRKTVRTHGIVTTCTDTHITFNHIEDVTNAGIVVQAPSVVVANNTVMASTQTMLGGILCVDPHPYMGNYSDVLVIDNTVVASQRILIGVALGVETWYPRILDYNTHYPYVHNETIIYIHGATVLRNKLRGDQFTYGIVVNTAHHVVVVDNEVQSEDFIGRIDKKCKVKIMPPSGYSHSTQKTSGIFQKEFVDGHPPTVACIEEGRPATMCMAPGWLSMTAGESLLLANHTFEFSSEGNLILTDNIEKRVVWTANTVCGSAEDRCVFEYNREGWVVIRNNEGVVYTLYDYPKVNAFLKLQSRPPYLSFKFPAC